MEARSVGHPDRRRTLGRTAHGTDEGSVPAGFPFNSLEWNRDINNASYNSSVVMKPDSADTFRVMTSKGLLLPNLINLGALVLDTPTFGVTGSPLLRPSIVTNYEVSWDRALTPLAASLRVRIYHQETDDMVSLIGGGSLVAPGNLLSIRPAFQHRQIQRQRPRSGFERHIPGVLALGIQRGAGTRERPLSPADDQRRRVPGL